MGSPTRHDGRVESGQKISTAFSARAWNRAQDAADIVLGDRPRFGAGSLDSFTLPSVRVKLRERGWYGQCRFADCDRAQGQGLAASVPVTNATLGDATESERALVALTLPITRISSSSHTAPQSPPQSGLFVCVGNDSSTYAMAGFAITRIRVFNYLHRYARCPTAFTGQTTQQASDVQGCLDSAFWGTAKIVGYCGENYGPAFAMQHLVWPGLEYPNFEYRWALIQF